MLLLAKRLIDLRESQDLSKSAVARILNMSPTGYSGYETGRNYPQPETLMALAEFYGVTVDYILGYEPKNNEFNHMVKEIRSLSSSQQKKVAEYINLLKTYDAYQKYQAKDLAIQERKKSAPSITQTMCASSAKSKNKLHLLPRWMMMKPT